MDKNNSKNLLWILLYFIITAVLVELDQISKVLAVNALKGKADIDIIKGVLSLSYLENSGAAWGIFSGKISMFMIITVVMLLIISYVVIRIPKNKKYIFLYIICILLASGAIGNFIDRIRFGYVRDFIYFNLINFPIFNVADCFVTISVALLIIAILFVYKEGDFAFLSLKKKEEPKDSADVKTSAKDDNRDNLDE